VSWWRTASAARYVADGDATGGDPADGSTERERGEQR
jgi:hypothetical protein